MLLQVKDLPPRLVSVCGQQLGSGAGRLSFPRLAPTLCCFGTEELAGPSAAAGRVTSYDATAMGAAFGPCPSSLTERGPNRRRGGE